MSKVTIDVEGGAGHWRWRVRSANSRILGASSESFEKRVDALRNLYLLTGYDVRVDAPLVGPFRIKRTARVFLPFARRFEQ